MTSSNPNHPEGPTSDRHRAAGRGPQTMHVARGQTLHVRTWLSLPGWRHYQELLGFPLAHLNILSCAVTVYYFLNYSRRTEGPQSPVDL